MTNEIQRTPRTFLFAGLFGLLAIFIADEAAATGPSFRWVDIEPIAVNTDGAVAFKAYSWGNPMGAHTRVLIDSNSRWICASENGAWYEHIYSRVLWGETEIPKDLSLEAQEHLYVQKLDEAREAFKRPVPIDDPPGALKNLLETCAQGAWRQVAPELGAGRATWSPSRFCLDGVCVDQAVPQKTIGEVVASSGEGEVRSSFVYGRMAVFYNESLDGIEQPSVGAYFPIDNPSCDPCAYDVLEASGISLIPASLTAPAKDP